MTQPEQDSRVGPTRRVIVLGASNVSLGLSTIIETARNAWGRPLELLIAGGHGRSYGIQTSVLGRGLPGISTCQLWQALEDRPSLPTAALVTDIGNDIIFGNDVERLSGWLEICLSRLSEKADRLIITRLPWESLAALSPGRFRLVKSLFFPGSRLDLSHALDQVLEMNHFLTECANRYHAYVIHPDPQWYGWDPIHIRRRKRPAAWQRVLSSWCDGRMPPRAEPSLRRWFLTQRLRPLDWRLFGFSRHRSQPCGHLPDGSTISLY